MADKEKNLFLKTFKQGLIRGLFGTLFPSRLEGQDNWLAAERKCLEGSPLIVAYAHPTTRDPALIALLIRRRESPLEEKRVLAPVALHQRGPAIGWLADAFDIETKPIVTQRTMETGGNGGLPLNYGVSEYLSCASGVLAEGGIVFLTPQGTREAHLEGSFEVRPIGTLLAAGRKTIPLEKVSLVPVAVEIPGVVDYGRFRGLNLLRGYSLRVGQPESITELTGEAAGFARIDAAVFSRLERIVPRAYLKKDDR